MKLHASPVGHTRTRILSLASGSHAVTPAEVLRAVYKTTKQPEKKIAGFHRHMRWLTLRAMLEQRGEAFAITPAGRAALSAAGVRQAIDQARRSADFRRPLTGPRLVR